jgi:DNA polymerase-3 subunit beta
MEFRVNREKLVNILSKAMPLTSARTDIFITECVHIRTKGNDKIIITASDLQTEYRTECDAEIIRNGEMAINNSVLLNICKNCQDDIVVNEIENRWFSIKSGNSEFNIATSIPDDFPVITDITENNVTSVSVKHADLALAVKRAVALPVDKADHRAHISSCLFAFDNAKNIMSVYSTDGARLSYSDIDAQSLAGEEFRSMIPKTGLKSTMKQIAGTDADEIVIRQHPNHTVFIADVTQIVVRNSEGDFPNVEMFHKMKENCGKMTVDREVFKNAIDRASAMATTDYRAVQIAADTNKKDIELTLTNADSGQYKENIQMEENELKVAISLNLNVFFSGIALAMLTTENAVVGHTGNDTGVFFMEPDNERYFSIVMPLRA